ncbi:DUF3667 domain-containing protein [Flavobacterium pallidum]|uniref:DUF3667 domain-containing protein n=1 Tax=Flavobacterium pallidum TaxID=2172098 RepID=A0A2S1SJY0_9FLAO|nr:DUF3667 domain-containing protein [Flavobacterium pallidum]AWI26637.1 hypothetical protein HYN49_12425 [Flavobacterium pallidum]
MNHNSCLNCGKLVHSRFCPDCGQRTDTHRIVLKHFLLHDLLHGVWHLERGILFTIREAFVRPGQAALDYVSGKRIRYYNVFYLCLLIIGLNIVLNHFYDSFLPEEHIQRKLPDGSYDASGFFKDNIKFILLGIVPMLGLSAYTVFGRLKLNLAEHFILGGICLLGELVIGLGFFTVAFLVQLPGMPDAADYAVLLILLTMFFYPAWVYGNATKGIYKWWGKLWRMILFYILSIILMLFTLGLVLSILSGFKGTVSF